MSSLKPNLTLPHPFIWTLLYLPSGSLIGFVSVALTYLATHNGLSITEGALIVASQAVISWLKWLWAPVVDVSLSPKRWYLISTCAATAGLVAMSVIPLQQSSLPLLMVTVAAANFMNSIVGMSVEKMIALTVPPLQVGRVSAWFQAGNLGGIGAMGALALFLLMNLSQAWMAGALIAVINLGCCFALFWVPAVSLPQTVVRSTLITDIKIVARDFRAIVTDRFGALTALLCLLPLSSGAAQATLTQAVVAKHWGAGVHHVELVQGILAAAFCAIGCFVGGWICKNLKAHDAFLVSALFMSATMLSMAASPHTLAMYFLWNLTYALGIGMSYVAFTNMTLKTISKTSAATGYNVFASLSNFPFWWVGLLLGWTADRYGPRTMLFTEAALGIAGTVIFLVLKTRGSSCDTILDGARLRKNCSIDRRLKHYSKQPY